MQHRESGGIPRNVERESWDHNQVMKQKSCGPLLLFGGIFVITLNFFFTILSLVALIVTIPNKGNVALIKKQR